MLSKEKQKSLQREIPILKQEIQAIYSKFDKSYGLHGANVPISFGFEEDLLGSYTKASQDEDEHFHFSLHYVGYGVEKPLSKEDRMDLYKHEYAHYMQYNMHIPAEYTWQPGNHGSAWKYCCSLVGAAPTPYYKAGEALLEHDYESSMKQKSIFYEQSKLLDQAQRERAYQAKEGRITRYKIGEEIRHPKFGTGIIEDMEKLDNSVRLHIRFGTELRKIDQKWLVKQTKYKRFRDR